MKGKTVPHQRIIHINRERVSSDFLGIKNDNWQAASRTLGAHALRLYLYLASNADQFELALSPAAIEAAIGMPRSTYHDQFRKLVNLGYLVESSGNRFDFYELPQTVKQKEKESIIGYDWSDNAIVGFNDTKGVGNNPFQNIEINNK